MYICIKLAFYLRERNVSRDVCKRRGEHYKSVSNYNKESLYKLLRTLIMNICRQQQTAAAHNCV